MESLHIAHLFPDLMNLYGDGGNVKVLRRRCEWRDIPCKVTEVHFGEDIDLSTVDLVFLGGGPDREQKLASEQLMRMREGLKTFVESDGAFLGICGGYQILGTKWLLADETMEGLSLVDIETRRGPKNRLIDNIVLESGLSTHPVVGYENHAGRTFLMDDSLQPFGRVISSMGHGNNDDDKCDGVVYKSLIGTYLHGPLLGKNPEVADWLLQRALSRKMGESYKLKALDDSVELAANASVCKQLGV